MGLWRNVCPLAALNQLPRTARFTRAGRPPEWLLRHGYLVAVGGLLVAVSARKWLFNDSATATAALIVAAMLLAFTGGVLFRGKSGWCSLVCPVLPVERSATRPLRARRQSSLLTLCRLHEELLRLQSSRREPLRRVRRRRDLGGLPAAARGDLSGLPDRVLRPVRTDRDRPWCVAPRVRAASCR
ncbi:MAG: hypothetical protein IPI44_22090 [Sulfuritalea sp.]|nr:hypothetical protein [Sulfuritalea sp.]